MTEATLLGGRYELGAALGQGGMAQVYLGRDTRLGRDVAVKILRADLAADPTFIARFRREAQSAASLNHPNIVSVFDTGDDDGLPYIVMEYVEGQTLRDVIRSDKKLQPERAMELASDVCAALEHAHHQGIVHRDIKPGNVMLTPRGVVKVMDFGIARAVTSNTMTQTAAVIGTAQYLSPEQARGEHVDARSDVYSTGCLLYELLTGTPPFSGDSPVAVAYQHVREEADVPSSRTPGLDAAVDAVVMKALAKNPGNRYQTAAEMRDDLLRAVAGRPVAATPLLNAQEQTTLLTPAAATTVMLPAVADREAAQQKRAFAYIALAIATIAVFVGAALIVRALIGEGGGDVRTPQLIGMTQPQAQAALEAVGLKLGNVDEEYVPPGSKYVKGQIFDQDPVIGIALNKGDGVDVKVSLGVRQVEVPNIIGLTLEEARETLSSRGLKVGNVAQRDVNDRKDEVLDTDPKPGATVFEGSTVHVAVASGKVTVPDVVGLSEADARSRLEQAGLDVDVQRRADATKPPGTVLESNPPKNSRVDRGSTVTIVLAEQQASPSPTPTESPLPTDSPSPTPTGTASAAPPDQPAVRPDETTAPA